MNVEATVVDVAVKLSATTPPVPTTERGAYGEVVPIPRPVVVKRAFSTPLVETPIDPETGL